jgi:hypothetical protein
MKWETNQLVNLLFSCETMYRHGPTNLKNEQKMVRKSLTKRKELRIVEEECGLALEAFCTSK